MIANFLQFFLNVSHLLHIRGDPKFNLSKSKRQFEVVKVEEFHLVDVEKSFFVVMICKKN